MGGMGLSWMMMLLMMGVGQGSMNDALDLMDTAAYWKAQKVEMTVETLADQTEPAEGKWPRDAEVRRLMAIRALGELKKKEALATLTPLLKDERPFVADYARQAIASIEGTAYKRAGASAEQLKSDLALLPAGCGVVAQATVAPGSPVLYDKVFELMKAMNTRGTAEDLERVRKELTDTLTQFVGTVGNFRIQAATIGVSGEIGNDVGFIVVVGRGLVDPAAAQALKKNAPAEVETVEGFEVYRPQKTVALVFPSADRVILFAGPSADEMPVEEVLKSIKSGKGGLDSDAGMKALVDGADRSKRLWAVMKTTKAYRKAELLEPFDSLALAVEEKEGESVVTLVARGKDAQAIKAAVETFEKGRLETLEKMKDENAPEEMKGFLKHIVDFVEGVKTVNDGDKVTLTATFKGGPAGILGALPLMLFAERHTEVRHLDNAPPPPPHKSAPAPEPEEE